MTVGEKSYRLSEIQNRWDEIVNKDVSTMRGLDAVLLNLELAFLRSQYLKILSTKIDVPSNNSK